MKKVLEMFGEPIISGGQEAFVNNLIMNMDYDELTIDLFTPYYCGNEIYRKNIIDRGGNVFEANLKFAPGKSRKNIIEPLNKLLTKRKYDVVHIHSGSISALAYSARAARKAGVKRVIVHSHSSAEHETLRHIFVKYYTKCMMENYPTDYFACSLEAAKCKFTKRIVIDRVKIINNGIDLEKYAYSEDTRKKARQQLKISEDAFVVGHVGRFAYEKNHIFIVELFRYLMEKDSNMFLILAGDGETMPQIKQKVIEYNIENNVLFLGNISNVNEVMQAMDVFVLPSLYEGLPIVGVEAQAAGLPLLVSANVTQNIDLTDSVRFISINDVKDWINPIFELKNMPRRSAIDELRKKGFDIKDTAKLIRDIYVTGE